MTPQRLPSSRSDSPRPRFHGSYLNLHYGYLPDALVDLTGGVVTSVNLHSSSSDLVMVVKMAAKAGSLMTCATPPGVSTQEGCALVQAFSRAGVSTPGPFIS